MFDHFYSHYFKNTVFTIIISSQKIHKMLCLSHSTGENACFYSNDLTVDIASISTLYQDGLFFKIVYLCKNVAWEKISSKNGYYYLTINTRNLKQEFV